MSHAYSRALVATVIASGMLAACGGNDYEDPVVPVPPAAPTTVPLSAVASSMAYTQFTVSESAAASETSEPLGTENVTVAPSSETDEPLALT